MDPDGANPPREPAPVHRPCSLTLQFSRDPDDRDDRPSPSSQLAVDQGILLEAPSEYACSDDDERRLARGALRTPESDAASATESHSMSAPVDISIRAKSSVLECEKDFMDFLLSLPPDRGPEIKSLERTRRHSRADKGKPKVGLDHLDNLCKLMEQLGDLKEQNSKLQRRVQYLEDMKDLHEVHKRILCTESPPEEFRAPQRTPSPAVVTTSTADADSTLRKSRTHGHLHATIRRSRERSKSVGNHDDYDDPKSYKNKRFPNWSKVKEALGWERSTADYEGAVRKDGRIISCPRQDGELRLRKEELRASDWEPAVGYPQSRSWTEDSCFQGRPSSIPLKQAGGWTTSSGSKKTTLRLVEPTRRKSSPTSPIAAREAAREEAFADWKYPDLLDPEMYESYERYYTKEDSKKVPKSAWGRVKTLIQTGRETVRKQHQPRSAKPGSKGDVRIESDPASGAAPSDPEDSATSRSRNTSRMRKISDPYGCSPRNSKTSEDLQLFPKERPQIPSGCSPPEVDGVRRTRPEPAVSAQVESEESKCAFSDKNEATSPQFQRKSRWNRVKKVFSTALQEKKEGDSEPSSPTSTAVVFDFEDVLPFEDDIQLKHREGIVDRQRVDSMALSSDFQVSEGELSAPPLSHSASTPAASLMLELQRNLSEDFSQKMIEWERIKAAKVSPNLRRSQRSATAKPPRDKSKTSGRTDKNHKQKDLSWLNRELQKMEREKERLSKETHKFQERSIRLQRLRHALVNAPGARNEVLVRTSAGEFRFEGISDAFTKKLYEWETKKGVVPEFSTIALLDASLRTTSCPGEKLNQSHRGLSRSESSIAEPTNLQQQSRASTSSLPSMKLDTLVIPEEKSELARSRASSEPDLSTHVSTSKEAPVRVRTASVGSSGTGFAPPEVTWLIDSGSGDMDERSDPKPADGGDAKPTEDGYYGLLEENMLLLEQLRAKEHICGRLEVDLERLDQRLELTSTRHRQEIERYRESLWKAHRPVASQSQVSSLRALADFRARLEDLERCNLRLQEERRALQESIRCHSQEQATLILDLIGKIKELQTMNLDLRSTGSEGARQRPSLMQLDADGLARIQQLSAQLLHLVHQLEATVAERARQVCQLRGEILLRDLTAEGYGTTGPGASRRFSRTMRSSSDGLIIFANRRPTPCSNGGRHGEILPQDRIVPATETRDAPASSPSSHSQSAQLIETVHSLRTELLRLFAFDGTGTDTGEGVIRRSSAADSMTESPDAGGAEEPRQSCGDARRSLASSSESPSRRSAPEALGLASGHDGSESSSINDSEHVSFAVRLPRKSWARTRDAMSTSSDSSYLEDDAFTRVSWARASKAEGPDRDKSCYVEYEDDVFNAPSSASSLEMVYSRARQELYNDATAQADRTRVHSEMAKRRALLEVTSSKTSESGDTEPPSTEPSATGCSTQTPNDDDEAPADSGVSELLAKRSSPVIRSRTSRRLKKDRYATTEPPPPWTTASEAISAVLRDSSSHYFCPRKLDRAVDEPTSPTTETPGPAKYFAYIPLSVTPRPATLQRFEALHRAKEAFVSGENPTAVLSISPDRPPAAHTDDCPARPPAPVGAGFKEEEDLDSKRRKSKQECAEKGFLSLRLRRGKKKDYSAVGQLCRQTLPVVAVDDPMTSVAVLPSTSPRSPSSPSSPETRARSLGRSKWLPLFATKS
ncbi:uncharacterized protein ISCGN_015813 [Ixodes scapularis]